MTTQDFYTTEDYNADLIIENERLRERIEVLETQAAKTKKRFSDYVFSAKSIFAWLKSERLKNDVSVGL